jgi:acetyltransferase-like isoleucine patch superfamily enzyme
MYLFKLLAKGDFHSEMEHNVQIARDLGVKIGENCRILGRVTFSTEPYLVELGNNVIVTGGTQFITHDGSVLMGRGVEPNVVGHFGRIKIGNNCFIGEDSMFLPNVEIGENCIVAARSLVIDSFPPDSVIMGNPAKVVFKTSMLIKMKLNSPNTIINSKYAYPYEEDIPKDIRKKMIIEQVGSLPLRKARKGNKNNK